MTTYKTEPWFAMLQKSCVGRTRQSIAKLLGVSAPALSQVLNGSGKYGKGTAGTGPIAERVLHTFGSYACPHLTDESGGAPQRITADQCRAYAHSQPPTGSPRAMQHWQACRACPHKANTALPLIKEVKPRKARSNP